ncbi:FkbM family methyltransferase [Sphingomonas naphthae]|uniref:FkbM family methyltransferase n=1 Tax=Sphingomonas naphthae TaxID=1813468 RepID=A0ABY7TR45_9SPHN|nr:FkbM family methyltransferase [Sphingomonas naphthae]WCT74845.1 FkbM family methyltransferase [Sphingomonas naphthae]
MQREDVASAYRAILGRDPQDEAVIDWHIGEQGTLERLIDFLLGSEEFRVSGRVKQAVSPALAFEAVYGRAPDEAETVRMTEYVASLLGLNDDGALTLSGQEMLRAAVTAFPRDSHPTSISARFVDRHLLRAAITGSAGRLVLDRLDWSVASTIIATGEYERHLGRFIRHVVKPGMTCVDIGANVGFHTMVMSGLVGDSGRVYAIEPNSENCRMLMLSIEENDSPNITVIPVALSNELGAVAFSPAVGSNGSFMYTMSSPLHHPNCIVVPTVRLDTILSPDRLDFIKIDVEGAEALALKGAESLIERHRPIITSEFSAAMLEGLSGVSGEAYIGGMMARGYRAYTLGGSGPYMEIGDPQTFMASWPDRYRIEDLAFVPNENPFDFEAFVGEARS